MSYTDFDERLTSDSVPATDATLTVRVIKSFEYRTEKSLVLQHVNLEETSVAQLKLLARQGDDLCLHCHAPPNRTLFSSCKLWVWMETIQKCPTGSVAKSGRIGSAGS